MHEVALSVSEKVLTTGMSLELFMFVCLFSPFFLYFVLFLFSSFFGRGDRGWMGGVFCTRKQMVYVYMYVRLREAN